MAMHENSHPFRDVDRYPDGLLKKHENAVEVFATYNKAWDDGFGARGWKLNASLDEPEIIASTRQTGERIGTSVFVHDILDHFCSGFGVSGHRCEAMALVQLARRTASDPRPDFEQMIDEDILQGRVNGEPLLDFLPPGMRALLPDDQALYEKGIVDYLVDVIGRDDFVEALVKHFFLLGRQGGSHAAASWDKLGLDIDNAANTATALQVLLEKVDAEAERSAVSRLYASILLSRRDCVFITTAGGPGGRRAVYHTGIDAGRMDVQSGRSANVRPD